MFGPVSSSFSINMPVSIEEQNAPLKEIHKVERNWVKEGYSDALPYTGIDLP